MKLQYKASLLEPFPMMSNPAHPSSSLSDAALSGSEASKKRSREEDSSTPLSPEALAHMSRSERKRHREKKRRNDVNKGFDDLMELLVEIDPVVRAENEDRARRGGPADDHLLSRVELIGRTVEVLRRVHKENEERKLIIQQLLQKPNVASLEAAPASSGLGLRALGKQQQQQPSLATTNLSVLSGLGQTLPSVRPVAGLDPVLQQQLLGGTAASAFLPSDLRLLASAQALSRQPISLPTSNVNFDLQLALSNIQQQRGSNLPPGARK